MEFNKKMLDNGLTVIHEKRDVPVTTVMLAVKYGSAYEDAKEKGIAHFIEHLCFKGTEKRNTKEIAESLEKVGGTLNAFTSEEMTAYHVKLPSKHLGLAMDVIFDIFFNPVFPEEEVKKEANVICEEIRMYNDNPRAHVMERIKSCLYESPFGMFIAGTEENVGGMTREKLIEKHRRVYSPENAILCVVGNNNFEEILKLAEDFSVSRGMNRVNEQVIKKINLKLKEKREGIQQVNIAIGFHFPKFSDKDRYAAEVFTTILGDGMSSKLFTEVREKRGLAYAVKADIGSGKNYGYMIIFIGTDKKNEEEAIRICLEEMKKMENTSLKELEEAKQQVLGSYDVDAESSNDRAVNLILEEVSGKAEDYLDYANNINKVDLEDLKKLARFEDYSCFSLVP